MAGRRIILTADDYGAMDFIDKAIIECIKNKSINCVSCFVCHPTSMTRVLDLVKLQKEEALKGNNFGIGLHFSITSGSPALRVENSLSERVKGILQFKSAKHYPFPQVVHTHLAAELEEQIRLLANWVGGIKNIDHLSNHHGVVYIDDEFFNVYSEIAAFHEIPIRSPKLWSRAKPALKYDKEFGHIFNPLTRYGIYQLQWAREFFEAQHDDEKVLDAEFRKLSFTYVNNDCIYGLGHNRNLDRMLDNYRSYEEIATEFMFHLGYFEGDVDQEPDETVPNGIDAGYFAKRRRELDLLRHYDLPHKLQVAGIERIPFRLLGTNAHHKKPI